MDRRERELVRLSETGDRGGIYELFIMRARRGERWAPDLTACVVEFSVISELNETAALVEHLWEERDGIAYPIRRYTFGVPVGMRPEHAPIKWVLPYSLTRFPGPGGGDWASVEPERCPSLSPRTVDDIYSPRAVRAYFERCFMPRGHAGAHAHDSRRWLNRMPVAMPTRDAPPVPRGSPSYTICESYSPSYASHCARPRDHLGAHAATYRGERVSWVD